MEEIQNFRSEGETFEIKEEDGPTPSHVSMKSDRSLDKGPDFSCGSMPSDTKSRRDDLLRDQSRCGCCQQLLSDPVPASCGCYFCRQCSSAPVEDHVCAVCKNKYITNPGLKRQIEVSMKEDCSQPADDILHRLSNRNKISLKNKYESFCEGFRTQENKTLLNRVYTQLYIIEGEREGVNEEHEVLQIENDLWKQQLPDLTVKCSEIFKPINCTMGEMVEERREHEYPQVEKVKTVMTKGIAGIGKTVSVQKFILDWAEGEANQDIEFMFVLSFRELNLIKDKQYSLHGLLCDLHPELRSLDTKEYDVCKTVFIFDGLDESRIPLKFSECEKVSDVTKASSVDVLITNLIKGALLPSAHIWITSRPAAANQIPSQYISRVTEILGFNDPQKEEYFRKRISDQHQADSVISHIKTTRSLHIMCHIPVFCWISATVLQRIMKQGTTEIPKTLTAMYSHFLCTQTIMRKEKYEEEDEGGTLQELLRSNRNMFLKLSELAFKQLMKGNVMFYEDDLRECGIDVTEASVYSGICTEIFREESVLYQRKVYCFVHLSFQEFLAAFYVFHCYVSKNMEELHLFGLLDNECSGSDSLEELLKVAVDKSLKSEKGQLDLFLRFLVGMSLDSNQQLLQDLLVYKNRRSESTEKTVLYIKCLIQTKNLTPEKSINLFLCLAEMNDQSLFTEIQEFLKSEKCCETPLTPGMCSLLAYILQISQVLDTLDLKMYNTSEEGYRRLVPAVSNCRKALLAGCYLITDTCETLCSALKSKQSTLNELDLSNNVLQDAGVEKLCAGMKSSHCQLEILRLAGCNITENSCEYLCSLNSLLKELDLSNNNLQDSGVKKLCVGLNSSHRKLEILSLAICNVGEKTCEYLGSALKQSNNLLKELDLSNNDLQDSGVEKLCEGLKSSHCELETLRLSGCVIRVGGCTSLASALSSNPSHLKELDLSYNHPGDTGIKLLSVKLEDPHCRLDTLCVEPALEIQIKLGLRKYACELTFDPNTVNTFVSLSEKNNTVIRMDEEQSYPDGPERFEGCPQVLCKESLTRRCYWETEWSGVSAIAMAYKGISRKKYSDDPNFGYNEKSWTLVCSDNSYYARHNKKNMAIPRPSSKSNRVGVYLDWPAGTLSFYSVCVDTNILTHLYTFISTFTEPLYAGIGFGKYAGSSVCIR
ncbi:NACHT, LRR and PYD domains-containing protein 3-like [Hoplias malabaricus]|uniref:NACHT, LRR and PYD domains-containing protein 3-like n=1 Tax=Hoplias malabaricus TaxID=27720 RepID=UPI003462F901